MWTCAHTYPLIIAALVVFYIFSCVKFSQLVSTAKFSNCEIFPMYGALYPPAASGLRVDLKCTRPSSCASFRLLAISGMWHGNEAWRGGLGVCHGLISYGYCYSSKSKSLIC